MHIPVNESVSILVIIAVVIVLVLSILTMSGILGIWIQLTKVANVLEKENSQNGGNEA